MSSAAQFTPEELEELRQADRAGGDKQRQYERSYYARNAEKMKAKSTAWRKAHPEEHREYMRVYYANHKDYFHKKYMERKEREQCQKEQEFQQKENGKRSTCSSSGERRKESVLF